MKQAKVLTDAEMERLLAIIANDKHSEERRGLELINRLGVHYYNSEAEIDLSPRFENSRTLDRAGARGAQWPPRSP